MKALCKSIKSSFFALLLIGAGAYAEDIVVKEVKGRAFYVAGGRFVPITVGQHIRTGLDVYTEEGGQLTATDFKNRSIYLSGSGHIKLESGKLILQEGYLWFQSPVDGENFAIESANGFVKVSSPADFIYSFDNSVGKSQVMVISGIIDFANSNERDLLEPVSEGHFSFVDNEYEGGAPRKATPVGTQTFQKITLLFGGVKPMNRNVALATVFKKEESTRAPASEEKIDIKQIYKEEIKSELKVKRAPAPEKKSGVIINVFGSCKPSAVKKGAPSKEVVRAPASMSELSNQVSIDTDTKDFESSLSDSYKKQMRHSNEVNGLINELKSYGNEFHKSY